MLYEKIPNAPRYNFTIPPYLKDSHVGKDLIGTESIHHTTAYDHAPYFKINVVSFDKGKSEKQPRSKKKGKYKKKKTSNPKERSFD